MSNNNESSSPGIQRHGQRIQELLAKVAALDHPEARGLLEACIEELLAFHGQGLARMLEVVRNTPPGTQSPYAALLEDDLVRGFLVIHGLHPADLETRLLEALQKVRPYLASHGGNVELVRLHGGTATLRLLGHCSHCPSSSLTLEWALRQAIEAACPDLAAFEVEGVEPAAAPSFQAALSARKEEGLGTPVCGAPSGESKSPS